MDNQLVDVMSQRAAILSGDAEKTQKQRDAGKKTARERAIQLLDEGSFVEMDTLMAKKGMGDGVVTGYGTVGERPVYLFSQDFTVRGGAMSELQAAKITKMLRLAQKTGAPVVMMCDSAGAAIDEGALSINAYADVFAQLSLMSGVCPLIALVLGPCVGGASLISQLADISIIASSVGSLMAAGPQVYAATLGKELSPKEIGGAEVIAAQGGATFTAADENAALQLCVSLLDLLPSCNMDDAPETDADLQREMTVSDAKELDSVFTELFDGEYFEFFKDNAKGIRVCLGRIGGHTAGVVANNGAKDDGKLCACCAKKAARFVRFCDCYSIPVVSLVNTTGLKLPELDGQANLMKGLSQLLYAYAEATCPKISIVTGYAIGPAYSAMGGKANADISYAWEDAVIAPLMPEAAVQVLMKKELKASEGEPAEARAELAKKYCAETASALKAAESGIVDDVIEKKDTRKYVIAAIEMLASKRDSNPPKKHGNQPM